MTFSLPFFARETTNGRESPVSYFKTELHCRGLISPFATVFSGSWGLTLCPWNWGRDNPLNDDTIGQMSTIVRLDGMINAEHVSRDGNWSPNPPASSFGYGMVPDYSIVFCFFRSVFFCQSFSSARFFVLITVLAVIKRLSLVVDTIGFHCFCEWGLCSHV